MSRFEGMKILVVDDEPFMLVTIKAALRMVGHFAVTSAEDGEAALREVSKIRPAVVFCDVSMVPISGLQFLERLRKHEDPDLRNTPVVLVTVERDQETIQKAAQLKVQGYMVKPVSPKQIKDRLLAIFPAN